MRIEQWVFDRCVEAESLFVPLAIFVLVSVIFITWKLTHKTIRVWWHMMGIYFFSIFIVSPLLLLAGYLIGIFNCTAGAFWRGIDPAFTIYKEIESKGLCPKTEKELSDIDPTSYRIVKKNAKTYGYCDDETGKYVWLVRPSKYYMMVFKNNETAVVKIPNQIISVHHWESLPIYSGDLKLIP